VGKIEKFCDKTQRIPAITKITPMARATTVKKHTVHEFSTNPAIVINKTIFVQTEFIRCVKHVLQPFSLPYETVVQPLSHLDTGCVKKK